MALMVRNTSAVHKSLATMQKLWETVARNYSGNRARRYNDHVHKLNGYGRYATTTATSATRPSTKGRLHALQQLTMTEGLRTTRRNSETKRRHLQDVPQYTRACAGTHTRVRVQPRCASQARTRRGKSHIRRQQALTFSWQLPALQAQ